MPPTASCDLVADGATLAQLAYPADWSTVTEPADLACRYFDAEPITVPADPATLQTAVMVSIQATPLGDAVAAATDPASWDVTRQRDVTVDDRAATLVEAVATADTAGIPVGQSSFAYFIDMGTAGTLVIRTTGAADDPAYTTNARVASLMAATSTFTPPS